MTTMKTATDMEELHGIYSPITDSHTFISQDFRVIRVILRLLSLWRPKSAGFLECYVYPIYVSLLQLTVGIIRNSIQATTKSTWLNVQLLYIVHEVVIWLCHIFGNLYFASRDLETNVLWPARPLIGISKQLHRKLKELNVVVFVSIMFLSIMLLTLSFVTQFINHTGDQRFSAELPHVYGPLDHIIYVLLLFQIVYNLGIGLALSWTLALFFTCYGARLKILENIFQTWKHSSTEAVSLFIQFYARPVKISWKRISLWFLAHNIIALAIPLYGYELAQAVSGGKYHSKHLPHLLCYFAFIVTIWFAPIIVGELIKQRERIFQERINNISLWCLKYGSQTLEGNGVHSPGDSDVHPLRQDGIYTVPVGDTNDLPYQPRPTPSSDTIDSIFTEISESVPKCTEYTFAKRGKEFRRFLQFLESRRPGLVSRGYSLQLNFSFISIAMGVVSFLLQLNSTNSGHEDMIYRCCNCTMH